MKKKAKKQPDKRLLDAQMKLFSSMYIALEKEQKELQQDFNVARNLACSEWTIGLEPSVGGGHYELLPTQIFPEKMDLLKKNFEKLLSEISYRRYALMLSFYPVFEAAHFPDNVDMQACWDYWHKVKSSKGEFVSM